MSLIAELKRRNVFKVTTAYLALGWVVLEGSGTVASVLRLPDWTSSFLFWLGLAGLPFVVVFAWVFELTPEGLQRTSEVAPGQSITHATSKRLDYVIIGMLAVAIGLFLLQYFRPPAAPAVATSDATVTPAVPAAEVAAPVQAPAAAAPEPIAVPPNDKSIAVLPFVNMSSDKEQEYFSDGMSEELLNLLAQARDLTVIARTSSFAFKGTNTPIAEIAKQLNVAHVLEGSVRKAGNTVRITAQLIRTADSTHLWSETYDRPLDDIFKVQDEIANAIVQALQIKLAGGTLSQREGGTHNLEAYELYLQAVMAINKGTKESFDAAESLLDQAVRVDPNYGLAWSQMAYAIAGKADFGFARRNESYERAWQLAEKSLQLSPSIAEAHAMLMYIHLIRDLDWAAAEIRGQQALAINPRDAWTLQTVGIRSNVLGRWDDAERWLKASLAQDPLNPYTLLNLGQTYFGAGRFAEAEREYREALRLAPDMAGIRTDIGWVLLADGRPEAALATIQHDDSSRARFLRLFALRDVGREAESEAEFQLQSSVFKEHCPFCLALIYSHRGDSNLALEWLERAHDQKRVGQIIGEPLFRPIAHDPRFIAFLKKMNLPTEPVPVNWQ